MNATPRSTTPPVTSTAVLNQTKSDRDQSQTDAAKQASTSTTRALVLAGAGSTGHAWELGIIAGLIEAGVDVTAADLIIGTSAGSTVAAQVTCGIRPSELYAATVAVAPQPTIDPAGSRRHPAPTRPASDYMNWSDSIIGSAMDASDMRRKMGAAARAKDTSNGSGQAHWRDIVAARLPSHHWPQQPVQIVAVNAHTGEPVVFDRHSGVDLVDAVAASTSNGFAGTYRIGDNLYINGGYRRSENADLAAGFERVLVLSPFGGRSRMPRAWGMHLEAQVNDLRDRGSTVETIFPDTSAEHLFGANAMDPALRPAAALAGYTQGKVLASHLTEFWH